MKNENENALSKYLFVTSNLIYFQRTPFRGWYDDWHVYVCTKIVRYYKDKSIYHFHG